MGTGAKGKEGGRCLCSLLLIDLLVPRYSTCTTFMADKGEGRGGVEREYERRREESRRVQRDRMKQKGNSRKGEKGKTIRIEPQRTHTHKQS